MEISVTPNATTCDAAYPLLIEIRNTSDKDVTNIRAVAFVREDGSSQPYCVEFIELEDRLIKSGEAYSACWSTGDSRGVILNGSRIPDDALDDFYVLNPVQFLNAYGSEIKDHLSHMVFSDGNKDTGLSSFPKTSFGCRRLTGHETWRGKVNYVREFSGD